MNYDEAIKLTSSDNEQDLDSAINFFEKKIAEDPKSKEYTDPLFNYMGKAYWKKARLTGMTTKKYTTAGWRYMNEALLCWFKAFPTPFACGGMAKVYRFQTKYFFNIKAYTNAIRTLEEIKKAGDILNKAWGKGPLFTKSDKKLLDKCKAKLEQEK